VKVERSTTDCGLEKDMPAILSRLLHPRQVLVACTVLAGCTGPQSALEPAGQEAEEIANLFWWMAAGSVFIWVAVVALAIYAARSRPDRDRRRLARVLVLTGALAPTIVLAGLLIYGLSMLPDMIAPAPTNALRISVYGEQWWWRLRYEPPGWQPFEVANELRLPVGEPVSFSLHSTNVIHSFWIPSLAGKVDLIPGRVNRLLMHPRRTGRFRGTCAEYCGIGHANMALEATVMEKDQFQSWLEQQSSPAQLQPAVQERGQ
jgi:cytochrome c oxidase subunit 2